MSREQFKKETNKGVYADECCMQPSASYSDEYVKWLEARNKKAEELLDDAYELMPTVTDDQITIREQIKNFIGHE